MSMNQNLQALTKRSLPDYKNHSERKRFLKLLSRHLEKIFNDIRHRT